MSSKSLKATTNEILKPAFARNPDLCDAMVNCLVHREGWDGVLRMWGQAPRWAWEVYQEAFREQWG